MAGDRPLLIAPTTAESNVVVCQEGLSFWGGVDPETGSFLVGLGGERSFAARCTNDRNQVVRNQPSIKFRFTPEICFCPKRIDIIHNECFAALSLETSKECALAFKTTTREQDDRVC